MPNPRTEKPGRPHLARDSQQWIYDYIIQQTGLPFHWWSDWEDTYPPTVRSHAMVSKHLGRMALSLEEEAKAAEASGESRQALELYFKASGKFAHAQHTIFELNAEKTFLYEGLRRTYDQVIRLSPYRIERIEVPWEGSLISGFLHICPEIGQGPLVFNSPGCDMTCELSPNPLHDEAHKFNMHIFSFDGPGLGQANIRGIRLTADNYERAASVMMDHLIERPEIDPEKIVALGSGGGSFWTQRIAAYDRRILAAVTKNTYAEKYYLMNEDGPRWKQLFAFLTQSGTEEELDKVIENMTVKGYLEKITCPTLMITGEYDHRDPIEEVLELFDQLNVPSQLWLYADMFHLIQADGTPLSELMMRWAHDRVDGKPIENEGEVLYIEPGDEGPFSPNVKLKRRWFEESR